MKLETDFHMSYGGFSFIFFRDSVTEQQLSRPGRERDDHQGATHAIPSNPVDRATTIP